MPLHQAYAEALQECLEEACDEVQECFDDTGDDFDTGLTPNFVEQATTVCDDTTACLDTDPCEWANDDYCDSVCYDGVTEPPAWNSTDCDDAVPGGGGF